MTLERSTFKAVVAPALKQMLDARGVSFGYMDPRSDLGVEDLKTPRGVDAVLVGARFADACIRRSMLISCFGAQCNGFPCARLLQSSSLS